MDKHIKTSFAFLLILLVVEITISKGAISKRNDSQNKTSIKTININFKEPTFVYFEKNKEPNKELEKYNFYLDKSVYIKASISDYGNEQGLGELKIYKINSNSQEKEILTNLDFSLNKELIYYIEVSEKIEIRNKEEQKYFIEYTYSKIHDILIKFLIEENYEIYNYIDIRKNNSILELQTIYHSYIALLLNLSNYSEDGAVLVKITSNNFTNSEQINYIEEPYNTTKSFKEIISYLNDSQNKLEFKNLNDNSYLYFYSNEPKDKLLYIKIILNEYEKKLHSIKIAVIPETELSSYGSKILRFSKYSGLINKIDFSEYTYDNYTVFAHTNISSLLNVVGYDCTNSPNQFLPINFWNKEGKTYNMNKSLIIDTQKELMENNINCFYFIITNSSVDFSFYIVSLPSEYINVRRFEERREIIYNQEMILTPLIDIIIYNNYGNNFILYYDTFYSDNKIFVLDVDNELPEDKSDSYFDPHLVSGSVEASVYSSNDYNNFNAYLIKCESFEGRILQKGDLIKICLAPNEMTTITMPEGKDINYEIGLKIHYLSNIEYIVEFRENNKFRTLDNSNQKYQGKWNSINNNTMTIKNLGKEESLIFLKISIEKAEIKLIDKSIEKVKIEPNILYALKLPKYEQVNYDENNEYQIVGTYNKITFNNKINNFCIFNDKSNENYFTYPPKVTCHNYDKGLYEFNISKEFKYNEEYDLNDDYFYTFIFYNQSNDENNDNNEIYLNFKFIVFYNKILTNKILLPKTNDIIYYPFCKGCSVPRINDVIFIESFKSSNIEDYYTPIYIVSYNNLEGMDFNVIDYLEQSNSWQHNTKILQLPWDKNIAFKFERTERSQFSFQFGNIIDPSFKYEPKNNFKITGNFVKNKYFIHFDPLEFNSLCNYTFILINPDENYSFANIQNKYYLLNNLDKLNIKINKTLLNVESFNGEFNETIKNEFFIEINEGKNKNYYLLIIANKFVPKIVEFYEPLLITQKEYINEIIEFEPKSKEAKCKTIKVNSNKGIQLSILTSEKYKIDKESIFSIQLINNGNNNLEQEMIIFKGSIEENKIVYSKFFVSKNFSYILNASLVNKKFEIIFVPDENGEEFDQNICVQIIDQIIKKNYDEESKLSYSYKTSMILPYYIDLSSFSNKKFEILKFKFDKSKINYMDINVICFRNFELEILFEKHYNINYLKEPGDEYYYFGFKILEQTKLLYIEIRVEVNDNNNINIDLESSPNYFSIERKNFEIFDSKIKKKNISIGNIPSFYFIDLTDINNNTTVIFFTDLYKNEGFNFFDGNYFTSSPGIIQKPISLLDEVKSSNNNNKYLTLLTYSKKQGKNGFFEYSYFEDGMITLNNNCNRSKFYNKKISESKGEGIKYFICYYNDKNTTEKYKVSYSQEVMGNNSIEFYYTNEINSYNSINDIISNLKKNKMSKDKNNIVSGNVDIFAYQYKVKDANTSIIVTLKSELFIDNNTSYNIKEQKNKGIGSYLIIICCIIVIILLIFSGLYIYRKIKIMKYVPVDIESEISMVGTNQLIE